MTMANVPSVNMVFTMFRPEAVPYSHAAFARRSERISANSEARKSPAGCRDAAEFPGLLEVEFSAGTVPLMRPFILQY